MRFNDNAYNSSFLYIGNQYFVIDEIFLSEHYTEGFYTKADSVILNEGTFYDVLKLPNLDGFVLILFISTAFILIMNMAF